MKKILLFGLAAIALGGGVGFYMYNKPHMNMQSAAADLQVDATSLYSEYESDETSANTKYLGKILEVSGTVRETSTDEEAGTVKVMLDSGSELGGIICELDPLSKHKRTEFAVGEQVRMKGKCDGMLMDVVITRCVEE